MKNVSLKRLDNRDAFSIIREVARRADYSTGNDRPDKAQTEMSETYPAFSFRTAKHTNTLGGGCDMDFLTSKIKPMYIKYLSAAFGSALISSIYGVVDMAMVGQYQGPNGMAALAVVAPVWNIIYSLFQKGANQNRTGDRGVADLCLTAWLWRHMLLRPHHIFWK